MSISGDGGFLYSASELETAVRLKCNLVHLVWIDGAYDMVRFQEMAKYGRASGVEFGPVDVVPFAEAFGAKGLRIERPDQIAPTLKRALAMQGPVVVGIPVDYRDNHRLWRSYIPACSIELSKGRTTNPSTSLVSIRLSDARAGVYARFAVVRRARMVARGW